MATAIAEHCIYTIVHLDQLVEAERQGGAFDFSERKQWVTGRQLWQRAQKAEMGVPVLFADATDCSQLLYWGLLTKLEVKEDGTCCTVDRLRRLPTGRTPQELVLRSSGRHIAPNFIRPYAICRTPDFVSA